MVYYHRHRADALLRERDYTRQVPPEGRDLGRILPATLTRTLSLLPSPSSKSSWLLFLMTVPSESLIVIYIRAGHIWQCCEQLLGRAFWLFEGQRVSSIELAVFQFVSLVCLPVDVYLSIHPSTHPSIHCPSLYLCIYHLWSINWSIHLSIYLSSNPPPTFFHPPWWVRH